MDLATEQESMTTPDDELAREGYEALGRGAFERRDKETWSTLRPAGA
jgi:hypothetical protein